MKNLLFNVDYRQGGELKHRSVVAEDEHGAERVIVRSTWRPVLVLKVERVRLEGPDPESWKAVE